MPNRKNSAYFSIDLHRQTGSLERMLGRIRRRGFSVENMIVTGHDSNEGYRIELRLTGTRCFKTLAKHLANLIEVNTLSMQIPNAMVEFQNSSNGNLHAAVAV